MQVGQSYWHWQTWDSTGVPKGGRYGNVAWFVRAIGAEGFHVAWSEVQKCFYIYTIAGNGKIIPQFMCKRPDRKPVPLNRTLLEILVYAKRSYRGNDTLARKLERLDAEEKYNMEVEDRQLADDMEKEVVNETYKRTGLVTRPVSIIVPN